MTPRFAPLALAIPQLLSACGIDAALHREVDGSLDAKPIADYSQPLYAYLEAQNEGRAATLPPL